MQQQYPKTQGCTVEQIGGNDNSSVQGEDRRKFSKEDNFKVGNTILQEPWPPTPEPPCFSDPEALN